MDEVASGFTVTADGLCKWQQTGISRQPQIIRNLTKGIASPDLAASETSYQLPQFEQGDQIRWNRSQNEMQAVVPAPVNPPPPPPPSGVATYLKASDPFNMPVSTKPVIDPGSAAWIKMLAGTAEKGLSCTTGYGYPIWHTSESDPVISLRGSQYDTGTTYSFHWTSKDLPNTGSDNHMVVVEPSGTRATDLYGATISNGKLSAKGISQYDCSTASGSCVLPVGHLYGGRAAGINLLAGTILASDYKAGVIPHALAFACTVTGTALRPPADHNDGRSSGGIPEGARIWLPRSYDIATISSDWHMFAVAMQEFGAFVVDTGSGGMEFFGEASSVFPVSWTKSANLNSFPWSSCQVLANSLAP